MLILPEPVDRAFAGPHASDVRVEFAIQLLEDVDVAATYCY